MAYIANYRFRLWLLRFIVIFRPRVGGARLKHQHLGDLRESILDPGLPWPDAHRGLATHGVSKDPAVRERREWA